MTAILNEAANPINGQEEAYEFVMNSDGTITKMMSQNSKGGKCGRCGCNCPCRCKDCQPFCSSNTHF